MADPYGFIPFDDMDLEEASTPKDYGFVAFDENDNLPNADKEIPGKRHVLRSLSRAAERIGGFAGDVTSFANNLSKSLVEKVSGQEFSPEEEKLGNTILGAFPGFRMPTSEGLKGFSEKATKGYTAPQTPGEEFSDEVVGDVAVSLPAGPLRALGISLAGNLGKQGAKALGASEAEQEGTKLALSFLASISNPGGVTKFKDSLYDTSRKLLPEGATVSATKLQPQLSALRKSLTKGDPSSPTKAPALKKLDVLESKIVDGKVPIDELVELKKDINVARSGLYKEVADKAGRKTAKANLDSVAASIEDILGEYGSRNPQWYSAYKDAQAAHGGLMQSQKASNFIKKSMSKYPYGTAALLHSLISPATAASAGAGYGLVKGSELLNRITSHPVLRKYYLGVMKAAAEENQAALLYNAKKLEQSLQSEDNKTKR